jgi:hypothetical protein
MHHGMHGSSKVKYVHFIPSFYLYARKHPTQKRRREERGAREKREWASEQTNERTRERRPGHSSAEWNFLPGFNGVIKTHPCERPA